MSEPPPPPADEPDHPRPTPGGGTPQDPTGGYGADPSSPPPPSYQPPPYQPPPYQPPPYQPPPYPPPPYPQQPYQQPPYQQPPYQQGGYPPPGYSAAGYPPPGYQQGGYPPAAASSPSDRLGARLRRRPEPRFSSSLAGAGAALVLIGLLIWSAGYLTDGLDLNFSDNGDVSTHGTGRRSLGVVLFLVLAVVGYAVVVLRRRGPLATAGIVSGAIAVPLVLIFLTFDAGNVLHGDLPFNVDAVYIVSIIVWLASYFVVPGARGRSFLLGAAAVSLASYIAFKAAGGSVGRTASSAVSGSGFDTGGADSLAAVGLIFGLAYYAIAAVLDRQGRSGAAVAMAYAAFGTTVGGVISAVPSFKQVGTGILLILLGLALTWYGGRYGRRFTSWAWSVALVLGVGLLVQKAAPNSYTGAGIMFTIIGVVVAVVAYLVAAATNEAADIVEGSDARVGLT